MHSLAHQWPLGPWQVREDPSPHHLLSQRCLRVTSYALPLHQLQRHSARSESSYLLSKCLGQQHMQRENFLFFVSLWWREGSPPPLCLPGRPFKNQLETLLLCVGFRWQDKGREHLCWRRGWQGLSPFGPAFPFGACYQMTLTPPWWDMRMRMCRIIRSDIIAHSWGAPSFRGSLHRSQAVVLDGVIFFHGYL